MAILSNAVVNGSIRCLNKIYTQDLAVSGSSTFGALTASSVTSTGNITASGAFYSGINGLYINNKRVIRTSSTTDTWLRINEGKPFSAGVFFGSSVVRTDGELQVGNNGTYFKSNSTSTTIANLIATTSSLTTVTGSKGTFDNFNVLDTLRAKKYELDSIQSLGGEFLVCPVLYFSSSATLQISAISGTTITADIHDSSTINNVEVGGVQWTRYSKVKISGKLGNVVLGTCTGNLTAALNTTGGHMNLTFEYDGVVPLQIKTYSASEISDLAVMIYEKGVSSTSSYPVGIFMTGYGTNNQSYIDMYQGEETRTKPRVRLGKLDGMDSSIKVGGVQPSGWGLYADNAFLSGTINATAGVIGGITISNSYGLYTNSKTSATSTNTGFLISKDGAIYLGAYNSTSKACPFQVTSAGVLTATGAVINGTLTAGANSKIGPWTVTATSIYKTNATMGNATAGAAYFGNDGISITDKFKVSAAGALTSTSGSIASWSITSNSLQTGTWGAADSAMICTGTSGSKAIGGSASINGWTFTSGANFGVTKAGALYCSDVHVSGAITATSGTIGGCSITNGVLQVTNANITSLDASKINAGTIAAARIGASSITADKLSASAITVGGRNLIHGSRTLTIGGGSYATGTFRASGGNGTMVNETYSDSPVPGVTQGITITTTTASNEYGFAQDGAPLLADRDVTFSIWLKGSAACTAKLQSYWSNTSGEAESASLTVNVTTSWKRYTLTKKTSYNHTGISISYVYSQNNSVGLKLYCIAPMMEYGNFPSDWTPNADEIGGFTIDPTAIHTTNVAVTSNVDNSIALSSDDFTRTINSTLRAGLRFAIGDKFGVTGDGAIYAGSAVISGTLTAGSGSKIGDWDIGTYLKSSDDTVGASATNTNWAFWAGGAATNTAKFRVNHAGEIWCTNAHITGQITATSGTIGAANATNKITIGTDGTNASIYYGMSSLANTSSNGFYIGADGIALGKGAFKVTDEGALTATSATISGTITAGNGSKIGAWNINSTAIYNGTYGSNSSVYISTANMASKSIGGRTGADWRLTVGSKFGVTNTGALYCSSGNITGTITAGANSKIGPWTVTATSIYKTNATMGNATAGAAYFGDDGLSITDRFQVSSTGQLYFMNANCWGSFSSPEYDIYGENPDGGDDFLDRAVIRYDTKTHGSYQNADIYIGGETHELSSSSSGIYNGFAFRCKSDHSSNVIDAYATSFNFNPASTSSSATTSVSVHGSLSVTNGISGQLNSIRATSNKGIYITAGTDTYINPAKFSGNTPSNSNGTICLGATGARFKQIWCTQSSLNSTSDRNLKENIVGFDSRFEKAYMDLIPTTYTWKNFSKEDHHDRKHWGFIAQDVESALNQNGISNNETGFLCKDELDVPNAAGETIEYSLRYGEMIALNTHMTQKAHREIAELKDRIAYLETRLAEVTK